MRKVALYFLVSAIIQVCCSLFIGTIWSLMTDSFDMSGEKLITISAISSIITIIVFVAAKWTPVKRILQGKKLRESACWSAILAVSIIIPSMLLEALIPEAWKKDILEDVFKMILQNPRTYSRRNGLQRGNTENCCKLFRGERGEELQMEGNSTFCSSICHYSR